MGKFVPTYVCLNIVYINKGTFYKVDLPGPGGMRGWRVGVGWGGAGLGWSGLVYFSKTHFLQFLYVKIDF
jgi:hypothetical protein